MHPRFIPLLALALVITTLCVTPAAFGSIVPSTVAMAADAGEQSDRVRDERQGDQQAKKGKGNKDKKRDKDRKQKPKKPKPKKPKPPTCFGRKATILLKGNEETVGTPRDDVIVGDGKPNDFVLLAAGSDRVCTGGGNDFIGVSPTLGYRLLADGGPGADAITVVGFDAGNDLLLGGDGDDTIAGAFGADQIFGGEGNDRLFGGDGEDDLFGGLGNDRLFGGAGIDTFEGGPGADSCQPEEGLPESPC